MRAVPYDAKLPTSGQMGQERPSLDLRKYGSGRLDAEFKSKMLGQDWHFHANVKATVVPGGTLEYEHEAMEVGCGGPRRRQEARARKARLPVHPGVVLLAISDANLEAVRVVPAIGMSPSGHGQGEIHPMVMAAIGFGNPDETDDRSKILERSPPASAT